ncbi:cysteine synthase A [Flavobacterium sp. CF108]|uniref:2,3-diaminopropionate biosynthesis protein SbnA n=1 Tax=unclassified Flavobacterium TaxID=196869 RepID=UPI0008B1BA3D|nr:MULTISPECIES: 2,3-diaminopropionate biosynthesis protein SbnA [unclassified Flavobacterium]SEO95128.1 cysteine synthase A [Flavobacterium sp. fv08]SHH82253.1 cysteine synthase A [Flavobacterium sp. CF108]
MINNILNKVGNTPLISIPMDENPNLNIFAKLEFYNPTGSVKDRAACYIISRLLNEGIINKDTTLIESSSGNFGVALSAYAKLNGLKFICVIDKTTLPVNEMLIRQQGAEVICITQPDEHGGYLMNRLKKIKEILSTTDNIYWINQYGNPLNAQAYYNSLGKEICFEAPRQKLDYLFMGISSGGTITGVSRKVKEMYPNVKIIAVDVYGSIIFGGKARKRFIPGIGSSMRPDILNDAKIDDVVYVNEEETISSCRELLELHNLYAGGSSGSVYAAIKKYFIENQVDTQVNIMCVFADRGERYITTIYDDDWCDRIRKYNLSASLEAVAQ